MFGENRLYKLLTTHFKSYTKIYPNPFKLEEWVKSNMPKVYKELFDLGWNLNDENTWTETLFLGIILSHKTTNYRTGLYLTNSLKDYEQIKKVASTKTFDCFRTDFNLHNQVIILTCSVLFLSKDNLKHILKELPNNYKAHFYNLDPYNENDDIEKPDLEYVCCERELTPEEMQKYKKLIKFS